MLRWHATVRGVMTLSYEVSEEGMTVHITDAMGAFKQAYVDNFGRIVKVVNENGGTTEYTYDSKGNLTCEKDSYGNCIFRDYDTQGNLLSFTDTGNLTTTMTYDGDNRLITYNGEALQYDTDGNMTYEPVDGIMSELVYDCRNRLVSAGGVTYSYDAENIRVKAETAACIEEYVTDTVSASLSRVLTMTVYEKVATAQTTQGEQEREVVQATDTQATTNHNTDSIVDTVTLSAATTTTYLYGQGLICEETEGLYLYHHYNNLGSTMKLTNAVGQVVASYTYGTYGELLSGDTTLTHFLYNGRCGVSTDTNGLYYMRQRYYNAEIKRFVNQDILAGSLDNSQSLNRYSYVQGNPVSYTDPFGLSPLNGLFSDTNFTHCLLGLLSCIPGPVGAVASVADAAVYFFIDKDYGMAALSLMSAASMGLGSIATNIAKTGKMAFTAKLLGTTSNLLSNAASFGMSASAGMDMAYSMYEKYGIYGEQVDGSIVGEAAGLGMSILGCAISGKGIADDARKMGNMLGDAGFVNRMKGEVTEFAQGVKSAVDSVAVQAKAGFNRFVTEETGSIVIGGTKGGKKPNAGALKYNSNGTWTSNAGLIYGQGSIHGNRVKHVLEHTKPNSIRPVHTVFNVDKSNVIELIDEAWNKKGNPLPNDPGVYLVNMGKVVGTNGETNIRIVVRPNTNEIISAYPQ